MDHYTELVIGGLARWGTDWLRELDLQIIKEAAHHCEFVPTDVPDVQRHRGTDLDAAANCRPRGDRVDVCRRLPRVRGWRPAARRRPRQPHVLLRLPQVRRGWHQRY